MTNRLSNAYVAGLIDGEGCVSMMGGQGKGWTVSVEVGMTTPAFPILAMLHAQYGGGVRVLREETDRWAAARQWSLHGSPAAEMLHSILPDLVLKRPQAELALRFDRLRREHMTGKNKERAVWTPEGRRRADAMAAEMRNLNRKGPQAQMSPGWFARLVGDRWITPQASLFDDLGWAPFSGPWPRSGSMRSGAVWQRPPLAPATSASGGGSLLLTPTSGDGEGGGRANPPKRGTGSKDGSGGLREQVKELTLLPTPTAEEYGRNRSMSDGAAVRESLTQMARSRFSPRP